ncbi:hypothetical protein IFM89_001975 [Coptis chinensis]|uniref:Uncharacterized protein n=1 Tax=Coptis chinensis TaxID=261450 RepID=A0A835HIJ5_9MAGN|nr:hypothetical protein IFM89_001975 [Coptis chinensis]
MDTSCESPQPCSDFINMEGGELRRRYNGQTGCCSSTVHGFSQFFVGRPPLLSKVEDPHRVYFRVRGRALFSFSSSSCNVSSLDLIWSLLPVKSIYKQWLSQFGTGEDGGMSKTMWIGAINSLGVWFSSWRARNGLLKEDDNRNGFMNENKMDHLVAFAKKKLGVKNAPD